MNKFKPLKALVQTTFAAVAAIAMIGGLASTLCSAEPTAGAPPPKTDSTSASTNSVAVKAQAPVAAPPVLKPQLTGAELYSMHCNRCHPERYPTERTAAQWKTIMLHMQVRANIPGNQARLILQYLQVNSGR
jgi:cytochrome c5